MMPRSGSSLSGGFLEQFFGLIDLGCEVRASASIGVVQEHELAVLLADNVTSDASFPGGSGKHSVR